MESSHTWSRGPLSLAGADAILSKDSQPRFATAGNSEYLPKAIEFGTLQLDGFVFDIVAQTGEKFNGLSLPQTVTTVPNVARDWMNTFRSFLEARSFMIQWQEMIGLRSKSQYCNGESMHDAFWQTVCAGELHDSKDVAKSVALWQRVTRFSSLRFKSIPSSLNLLGMPYCLFLLLWHLVTNKPLLEFELQGRYTLHRRMVQTSKGYIGLASCAAKVGDCIVICKGSKVPLVLQRADKPDTWRYIGDAYIHGIMNGEAFDNERCAQMLVV
jgi:hypothetical protein